MNKILSIRIILLSGILSALTACSAGLEKRVNKDEGPISARARNNMAAENPAGLFRVGESFERSGNLQAALNIYGQTMAAAPDMLSAQVAYARVTGALGAPQRSISMLTALLEQHPENLDVRLGLAHANIRVGQFRVAVLLIDPLLKQPSVSAEILDLGGRLAQIAGEVEGARKLFGKALDQSPENPVFLRNMALSFALEGEFSTSVAMLQQSMDKASGLVPGKQSLALVYALSGQYNAAVQLARAAMTEAEVSARRFVYRNINGWSKEQQAMALLFNQYPTDILQQNNNAAN